MSGREKEEELKELGAVGGQCPSSDEEDITPRPAIVKSLFKNEEPLQPLGADERQQWSSDDVSEAEPELPFYSEFEYEKWLGTPLEVPHFEDEDVNQRLSKEIEADYLLPELLDVNYAEQLLQEKQKEPENIIWLKDDESGIEDFGDNISWKKAKLELFIPKVVRADELPQAEQPALPQNEDDIIEEQAKMLGIMPGATAEWRRIMYEPLGRYQLPQADRGRDRLAEFFPDQAAMRIIKMRDKPVSPYDPEWHTMDPDIQEGLTVEKTVPAPEDKHLSPYQIVLQIENNLENFEPDGAAKLSARIDDCVDYVEDITLPTADAYLRQLKFLLNRRAVGMIARWTRALNRANEIRRMLEVLINRATQSELEKLFRESEELKELYRELNEEVDLFEVHDCAIDFMLDSISLTESMSPHFQEQIENYEFQKSSIIPKATSRQGLMNEILEKFKVMIYLLRQSTFETLRAIQLGRTKMYVPADLMRKWTEMMMNVTHGFRDSVVPVHADIFSPVLDYVINNRYMPSLRAYEGREVPNRRELMECLKKLILRIAFLFDWRYKLFYTLETVQDLNEYFPDIYLSNIKLPEHITTEWEEFFDPMIEDVENSLNIFRQRPRTARTYFPPKKVSFKTDVTIIEEPEDEILPQEQVSPAIPPSEWQTEHGAREKSKRAKRLRRFKRTQQFLRRQELDRRRNENERRLRRMQQKAKEERQHESRTRKWEKFDED